jgi:hypothetical protein
MVGSGVGEGVGWGEAVGDGVALGGRGVWVGDETRVETCTGVGVSVVESKAWTCAVQAERPRLAVIKHTNIRWYIPLFQGEAWDRMWAD